MSNRFTLAIAVLAGVAIGATAVGSLKAQGKGPAYVITDFEAITTADGFAATAKGLPASLAAGGGKLVARTDTAIALDGPVPKRFAIFQFDSVEKAQAWYAGPGKDSTKGRLDNAKSRSFIVEGLPN